MKRAIVIGASGGIGSAVAARLEDGGAEVIRLSRRANGLDVTEETSVAAALGAIEGPVDLVFVATGALEIDGAKPEKTLKALDPQAMLDQFRLNTLGPAMVIKHVLPLLPRGGRSVLAVLSARVGSIGDNRLGGWYGYRAAKAAVNQVVHTAAIEIARTHKGAVCVALHPGTVATKFTEKYLGRHPAVQPAEAAANLISVIEGLTPAQSGGFFDYAGKEIAW